MDNEDKKKQNAQIQEALMGMMNQIPSDPSVSVPEPSESPDLSEPTENSDLVDASDESENDSTEASENAVGDSDNIDQIMNEIEGLRKDMKNTVSSSKNPKTSNASVRSPEDFEPALAPEMDAAEAGAPATPVTTGKIGATAKANPSPDPAGATSQPMAARDGHDSHGEQDVEGSISGMPEEAWLQETYANLKDSPSETHDMGHGLSANEGSLTLLVQGAMTVKLRHEDSMQEVGVSFGTESIHVFLADGAELHLPIRGRKPSGGPLKKRAA